MPNEETGTLDQATDAGQSVSEPGDAGQSFYSYYDDLDKKQYDFKAKEELDKHFKDVLRPRMLMHSDYSKKTNEVKTLRQQLENDRALHMKSVQDFDKTKGEIEKYKNWFATHPEAYKKLQEMANSEGGGVNKDQLKQMFKEEFGEDIEALKAEKKQREWERQQNEAFDNLSKSIPDFDKNAVQQAFNELSNRPENENLLALYEMLHYAGIGKAVPSKAKIAEEITEDIQNKKSAKLTGSSTPPKSSTKKMTFDEAAAEMKAKVKK